MGGYYQTPNRPNALFFGSADGFPSTSTWINQTNSQSAERQAMNDLQQVLFQPSGQPRMFPQIYWRNQAYFWYQYVWWAMIDQRQNVTIEGVFGGCLGTPICTLTDARRWSDLNPQNVTGDTLSPAQSGRAMLDTLNNSLTAPYTNLATFTSAAGLQVTRGRSITLPGLSGCSPGGTYAASTVIPALTCFPVGTSFPADTSFSSNFGFPTGTPLPLNQLTRQQTIPILTNICFSSVVVSKCYSSSRAQ